jgi:SPP1 gp7 family putative phage head morphogenesis protein
MPVKVNPRLQRRQERERFQRARRAEGTFARQLRSVARQVGAIVQGFTHETLDTDLSKMMAALHEYSRMLRPWARSVSARMLADVARRDETAWEQTARGLGAGIQQELKRAPLGTVMQQKMVEQVDLITSLPRGAAERVHRLSMEALSTGMRHETLAREILRTGKVTESRANTIARTEVGRSASIFTQVRAEHIGSVGYIWRTAEDSDVRLSHKRMNGKFVPWDRPPILDNMQGHAGTLPNCRCYPEPVLPEEIR